MRTKKHLGYFFFHFSLSSWSDASIAKLLQLRNKILNIDIDPFSIVFQSIHNLLNSQVEDLSLSSCSYFIRAAIAGEKLSLHKSEWQRGMNLFSNFIYFRSRRSCGLRCRPWKEVGRSLQVIPSSEQSEAKKKNTKNRNGQPHLWCTWAEFSTRICETSWKGKIAWFAPRHVPKSLERASRA